MLTSRNIGNYLKKLEDDDADDVFKRESGSACMVA